MDISLSNSVIGGYLNNELPNLVTGMIHLAGRKHPLRIELQGNFLRDIAGCRVEFVNAVPELNPKLLDSMNAYQEGFAGEMTASRRIRRMTRKNAPPDSPALEHSAPGLKNLFFLEWFNQQQQRVTIQAWHWTLRVSSPRWHLARELELAQLRAIRSRRRAFLLSR